MPTGLSKVILDETSHTQRKLLGKKFNPETMVTFFDFCILMGYSEESIEELYAKNSDIMVFDPKTKVKRSNSMRLQKFVHNQNGDKVVKIVPEDFFEQKDDDLIIIDKKDI